LRLIIQEYLSQLKESRELDKLLTDLLLAMKFIPITIPQIGVRQYGVDISAEYLDDKKNKILFLFVVKQGDIGRKEWNSSPQSVRQSLDEIKDVYLTKLISPEHKNIIKKIVLCTNGILKQEVEGNWKGYIESNTVKNEIEYELWNGFKLTQDIENCMLNEFILLGNYKSKLRKTLAFLDDSDYNLNEYYSLLKENLTAIEKKPKKAKRLLYSIRLILNIIYNWSKENNNLKPALYAAERTLLNTWNYFRINSYFNSNDLLIIFGYIFQDFTKIYTDYYSKIYQLCHIKNGFNNYSRYYLLENISLYEQLGIIAIIGLNHFYFGAMYNDKNIIEISESMKNSLKAFINNHKSISSPVYDSHIIEIMLSLILLRNFNENGFIESWINEIINRIEFAYHVLGRYFPIDTDSLEDAVMLLNTDAEIKKDRVRSSTLLLALLQFSAIIKADTLYKNIIDMIRRNFKQTTLQIWFPDNTVDEYLYILNAGYSSGLTFAPKSLPDTTEGMNRLIKECNEKYIYKNAISSINKGFMILPLIASRHFRTPILPLYWTMYIETDT
jgi:hypothetical protein